MNKTVDAVAGIVRKNGEKRLLKHKNNLSQEATEYSTRDMFQHYIDNLVKKLLDRYLHSLNSIRISGYRRDLTVNGKGILSLNDAHHYFVFNGIGYDFSLIQDLSYRNRDKDSLGKWRIHLGVRTFKADSLAFNVPIDNISTVKIDGLKYTDDLNIKGVIMLEMVNNPYRDLFLKKTFDDKSIRAVYNAIIDLWIKSNMGNE
jgi:hypothetical protein|nr:MAG TPA: hypothetical protein [Caudoviricetes sp.]